MDLVSSKWKRITLWFFFHFIVFLIFELENLLKKGLGRVNLLMENDHRFYYRKSEVRFALLLIRFY